MPAKHCPVCFGLRGLFMLLMLIAAGAALGSKSYPELEQEVLTILRERYQGASLVSDTRRRSVRMFSTGTEPYEVRRTDIIGGQQRPRRIMVPDAGGIVVRFLVDDGRYPGAAMLPYNGKAVHSAFTQYHVIRNSKDGERHIWAEIVVNREDPPQETVDLLVELFEYFDLYD